MHHFIKWNVNNQKCAPELIILNEQNEKDSDDFWHRKFTLKIKSRHFCHLPITTIFRIQKFPLCMLIFWEKSFQNVDSSYYHNSQFPLVSPNFPKTLTSKLTYCESFSWFKQCSGKIRQTCIIRWSTIRIILMVLLVVCTRPSHCTIIYWGWGCK